MDNFFFGHPFKWWVDIHRVLELYGVKDADQLAYMLRSRGNKPTGEQD